MEALRLDPYAPEIPPGQDELPCEDDVPMETPKHRQQMNLLIESLALHLGPRPDVYIGGNMGFYFSVLQAKQNDFRAPDFFVALDVIPDRVRKSWVVWEEGGRRPDVVIELLSDSTESEDRGRKARAYASVGVAYYYLFDPHDLRFEGFELVERAYRPMVLAADGSLPCPPLRLRLGVRPGSFQRETGGWLRWIDETGAVLPSGEELAAEERARAAEERARAERLAARLRAAGLDPDA